MGRPARFAPNHPSVIDETIDGEVVVIDLASGSYFSLLDSAATVWATLSSGATVSDIGRELAVSYAVDEERAAAAAAAFVDSLVAEGLGAEVDADEVVPARPAGAAAGGDRAPFVEPRFEKFDDMQQLILLDPVHEIDENMGWPRPRVAD